jgi:hypothetical protein
MIKAFSEFITRIDEDRSAVLVVACLLARGSCSTSHISVPTGLSIRSVRDIARALELRGIVRRDGRRWRIVRCFSRSLDEERAAVKAVTPRAAAKREKCLDVLFDAAGDYGANMAALLFEIADQ